MFEIKILDIRSLVHGGKNELSHLKKIKTHTKLITLDGILALSVSVIVLVTSGSSPEHHGGPDRETLCAGGKSVPAEESVAVPETLFHEPAQLGGRGWVQHHLHPFQVLERHIRALVGKSDLGQE